MRPYEKSFKRIIESIAERERALKQKWLHKNPFLLWFY